MTNPLLLLKAIREGNLASVKKHLDGGAPVELDDGQGDPGLPLGMACFMGHIDIARELISRGAPINRPDNRVATSPLSMAIRGNRSEVVRLLIELGADVPDGMATGLTENEVMLAQLKAIRDGFAAAKNKAEATQAENFEEIHIAAFTGVDTQVLEAEALQAARNLH